MALGRLFEAIGDERRLDQFRIEIDDRLGFELFNRTGHGADRAARAHDAEMRGRALCRCLPSRLLGELPAGNSALVSPAKEVFSRH